MAKVQQCGYNNQYKFIEVVFMNCFDFYSIKCARFNNVGEIFLTTDKQGYLLLSCIVFPPCLFKEETRIFLIKDVSYQNLKGRYNFMSYQDEIIEVLESEKDDGYSDDSLFNISSWGADLSFRELCTMYEENELLKPELQRKYVWDRMEASRFIESILMGLPVPSIFLAQSGSDKLIVDGYQRIMTVYDYIKGVFSADGKIFRLSNSEKINYRWRNKSFKELTNEDQRKIKSTTIHAIVFEQKKPENSDTSLYQIFERINTSGRTLTAQEIRNCVYQGSFNTLLFELNKNEAWRALFGSKDEDQRMRDIEFILRFFVMKSDNVQKSQLNQISLKKSLNEFMAEVQNADGEVINKLRCEFVETMALVYKTLGENAFRNYVNGKYTKKFHPAIFDAISVAFCYIQNNGLNVKSNANELHSQLLVSDQFKNVSTVRTTDVKNITERVQLALECFGEKL